MKDKIPVSVNVLTRNSAKGLRVLLPTLSDFAEILLIDGNSTDETLDLAKQYNCRVIKQMDTDEPNVVITDFSAVRNKGIEAANFDWILTIDSDEYIDNSLVEEIAKLVSSNDNKVFKIPRIFTYHGRIVEVSPGYPNLQIRLFNRQDGVRYAKPVHEKPIFDKEKIKAEISKNGIFVPLEDYENMVQKGKKYLDMHFHDLKPMSMGFWLKHYLRFYLRSDLSFAWRYFKTLFKRGHRMYFRHDFYIILYHDQMIRRGFKKMLEYYR